MNEWPPLSTRDFLLAITLDATLYFSTVQVTESDNKALVLARKVERAKNGYASYKPHEWIGKPLDRIDKRDFADRLRELSEAGLLIVERDSSNRPTWIKLTEAGEVEARRIATDNGFPFPENRPAGPQSPEEILSSEVASFRRCAEKTRERIRLYEEALEGYAQEGYRSDFVAPQDASRVPRWLRAECKRLANVEAMIRSHEDKLAAATRKESHNPKTKEK